MWEPYAFSDNSPKPKVSLYPHFLKLPFGTVTAEGLETTAGVEVCVTAVTLLEESDCITERKKETLVMGGRQMLFIVDIQDC